MKKTKQKTIKISARENKIPSVKIFSFLSVKKKVIPVKKY